MISKIFCILIEVDRQEDLLAGRRASKNKEGPLSRFVRRARISKEEKKVHREESLAHEKEMC